MAWVKFALFTFVGFNASFAFANCDSLLWGSSKAGKAAEMDYLPREAIYERTVPRVAHNLALFARSRYGAEVGPLVLARLNAADPSWSWVELKTKADCRKILDATGCF